MNKNTWRRWGIGLIAGIAACGSVGIASVGAQAGPIIVPSISSVVVGIPPDLPSMVGLPGSNHVSSRAGMTWSTTGRANVDIDVDVNQQHGQAAAG